MLLDTPDWKQCYLRSQTGVPLSFLTYPAATSPQYVRELRCLPSYKPSTRTAEALPHWLWGSSIHLWVLLSNTLCRWFQHSLIWKNDTPWDFILSYKGKLLLTFPWFVIAYQQNLASIRSYNVSVGSPTLCQLAGFWLHLQVCFRFIVGITS